MDDPPGLVNGDDRKRKLNIFIWHSALKKPQGGSAWQLGETSIGELAFKSSNHDNYESPYLQA